GAEDFFLGEAPVVRVVLEERRNSEEAFRERALFRRQSAEAQRGTGLLHAVLDVATDLAELLLVDDRAHVRLFVERVADLELRRLVGELLEEVVEDVGVEEETRAGRARLALTCEAHGRNNAVDDPVLIRVRIDDR